MSDTDDTDNLLLIPPDLFTIHSDSEDATKPYGPYYKVVDSLISQVNKLETRINSISTDSSVGNSLDNFTEYLKSTKLMSAARKYSSLEDLSQELRTKSNQNTPEKSKNKRRLSSLPNTPNISRYSPSKSKSRLHNEKQVKPSSSTQNEMLNEIDTFISNVKTIQKFQASRNLNLQFANMQEENLIRENALNLRDVDKMIETVESQKREIDSRLNEQKQELYETERDCMKEKTWQAGDTAGSVPDRGMGMRELLYKDYARSNDWEDGDTKSLFNHVSKQNFNVLTTRGIGPPQLSDLSTFNTESVCSENQSLSTDSTQTTAYHTKNIQPNKIHSDAAQVLNNHKKLLSHNTLLHSAPNDRMYNLNSQRNHHLLDVEPLTNNNLALLSLSELWNNSNDLTHADKTRFINKLKEEKLRRQHCEDLIQSLQMKMLEFQERIAVAVQVDKAKDEAISLIHKSWEESVSRIDELCKKNSNLEQLVNDFKHKLSQETMETSKKLEYYEKESSKALNLAHTSQERLGTLEKENNTLFNQLQSLQKQYTVLEDKYNAEQVNVHDLSKILAQKEIEINENKSILADARKEVSQSKKAVEICQTELTSMRITQEELERQLNQEVDRIKEIEKEKKRILVDIETHKKIENSLRDELTKQKEKTEQNKIELRNFYQDQVEIVVREKLREFQLQLEKAENCLQEELHNREITVAKSAALHIQQITEKHALEIHLLEEKQKEEIKLYNLQLSKAKQQIDGLQAKFQQNQERKSHIAQQLHKVMEAQWLEALKIINSKSPIALPDKSANTIDQLNSLKSKSYNNLEEILLKEELRPSENEYKNFASLKSYDDNSFSKLASAETPLTSRPQKTRQQLDQEMHKYIQMLLVKSPRNLIDDPITKSDKIKPQSPEDSELNSQQNNYTEGVKSSKMAYRDRLGKPPWK